jgi:hypothetical protein
MNRSSPVLRRLLWLLAFLALLEPFIQERLSLFYSSLTLPVALLVALMDWLNTPAEEEQEDYLLPTLAVVLLAFLLFFFALAVFRLPALINPDAPAALGLVMGYAWFVLAAGLIWTLLFWRLGFNGRWTTAILSGVMGGGLLALLLAYPAYTLYLHYFVAGFAYDGPAHWGWVIGAGALAALLSLALGPVAGWRARTVDRGERAAAGALAGSAAGIVLFGLLGAAMAGMIAAGDLHGVAVSRAGYSEAEWLRKFAVAVNNTFPVTILAFWLLAAGGGVTGSVTALLTPASAGPTERPQRPVDVWPMAVLIVAFPWLLLLLVTNVAVFTLLEGQLATLLEQYQAAPKWRSQLNTTLMALHPFVALHLIQILGLVWLWRLSAQAAPFQRSASCLGNGAALLGILLMAGLYLIAPLSGYLYLVSALLSVALLLAAWRLRRLARTAAMSPMTTLQPYPPRLSWITAGIAGGLLAAILVYQSITMSVSVVMLIVAMMDQLTMATAPPPGAAWLADIFQGAIWQQARLFLTVMTVGVFVGAITGWFISLQAPVRSQRTGDALYGGEDRLRYGY